jgi:hypothetical protein
MKGGKESSFSAVPPESFDDRDVSGVNLNMSETAF